ncbi:hypothetical protein D3C71_2055470 [compost metagenome]
MYRGGPGAGWRMQPYRLCLRLFGSVQEMCWFSCRERGRSAGWSSGLLRRCGPERLRQGAVWGQVQVQVEVRVQVQEQV